MAPDHGDHAQGYLEKYSLMNLIKGFVIDRGTDWRLRGSVVAHSRAFPERTGGLAGTTRGFGKFLQYQLRPDSMLFNNTTRQLFYTPERTQCGRPISMTLGWHIGTAEDVRFFYKEGGCGGFHCMMRVYPPSGIATVVMTNATGFDVRGPMDAIDPRCLPSAERRP